MANLPNDKLTFLISALLFENDGTNPKPTLQIAKEIFGPKGTCKMINSALYSMKKDGQIDLIADEGGRNSRWYRRSV